MAWGLLALGLGGVSTATLWIRMSDASAAELAFRRLALSLPLIWLWGRWTLRPARPESTARAPSDLRFRLAAVSAGVLLAAHFWAWNASLAELPAAVSLILVSTHPVLVLGVEWFRGRFPVRPVGVLGVLCALAGIYLLAAPGGDQAVSLRGIALALIGAITVAGYLLVGRAVQVPGQTPHYLIWVYGAAALTLAGVVLAAGQSWIPETGREWALVCLLAVFPTLLGHTPMNAALQRLPATVVSTAFLGEVVGASLLVWVFLGEALPTGFLGSGGLVALGIVLVALRPRKSAD